MGLDDLAAKMRAFNWNVATCDGHDIADLLRAFDGQRSGMPNVIIADTIKGKGCKPAEETVVNHHLMFPDAEANRIEEERMMGVVEKLTEEWRNM